MVLFIHKSFNYAAVVNRSENAAREGDLCRDFDVASRERRETPRPDLAAGAGGPRHCWMPKIISWGSFSSPEHERDDGGGGGFN